MPHAQANGLAFNAKASLLLRQYLSVVFPEEQRIFVWEHLEFPPWSIVVVLDGVHCDAQGQYCLYRSYHGAILKTLTILCTVCKNS